MMERPWPTKLLQTVTWTSCCWLLPLPLVYSQTGTGILALFYTVFGCTLLALVFAAALAFSKQARQAALIHRLATPTVLLLAAALFAVNMLAGPMANPFFRLRFALSEAALTGAAMRKLAEPSTEVPAWVGLFPIISTEQHHGAIRFITTNCGVVDACGLVYSPNHVPSPVYEDTFVKLTSAWYHVRQGF